MVVSPWGRSSFGFFSAALGVPVLSVERSQAEPATRAREATNVKPDT